MAIPDYQSIMLPLLKVASDGQVRSTRETIERLADGFRLNDHDRKELLPSGQQAIFDNRVGWARTYLTKAGLLESPRRGIFKITKRGLEVLQQNPEKITNSFLSQFPEFIEFRARKKRDDGSGGTGENGEEPTPEETIEIAYQGIRDELSRELLNQIMSCSAAFFEKMVVELLVKMGYGGSRKDAGQAIGRVGDEGIDGIIKEDRLGLDVVYLQAKKWDSTVGRPEIQKFVGALHGKRAKKGVFITTGRFSDDAISYVNDIEPKVILIDGRTLANYMIDLNLGTSTTANYEIKRIDTDYFGEE